MKSLKLIIFLITSVLMLSLSSCNSCSSKKEEPQGPSPTKFEESMTGKDTLAVKQLVNKFFTYAKEKNFTYDRQSEKLLKNLKEVAKFEGYMDNDSTLFNSLEAKLTPDLDRDFDRNKDQIKKLLTSEIMKRYYFQKGELINSLKEDDVLDKALEVLGDPALYQQTLEAPGKVEKTVTL